MSLATLKRQRHALASPEAQIALLDDAEAVGIRPFSEKMAAIGLLPLRPTGIEIFQVNVGKICNQVCKHCHVDAGPDRKEVMSRETMQQCLDALARTSIATVDITGGAPEMNPHFRWFVEEISRLGRQSIVRCNLTIILANAKYRDLPDFFRQHRVNVVSSLPYFTARRTDAQRGEGVFEKSIEALRLLNGVGYGQEGSGLLLDLVFNPSGAFLPGDQASLEQEFKGRLREGYGIDFNRLFTITNQPVSRFLEYLVASGNYERYLQELAAAFNPAAAQGVMCRNTLSVSWDGYLYDCDFNQMLELKVEGPAHISQFDLPALEARPIRVSQHCYACTAGAGSSCGGATT
jgi:radical SAM/Cys-rich protein